MDVRHLMAAILVLALGCDDADVRPPTGKASIGLSHAVEDPLPVRLGLSGGDVVVDEAVLVVSAVELHLCTGDEVARTFDALDALVPPAHAHVPSSGTRLGVPFAEELLTDSRSAKVVGELAPPVGEYCTGWAIIAPADDDVVNLTGIDTADLIGESVVLRGRSLPHGAGEWIEFESAAPVRRAIAFALVDPKTGEAPLKIAEPGDDAFLVVDKRVDTSGLQHLDVEDFQDETAATTLVESMSDDFETRVFR